MYAMRMAAFALSLLAAGPALAQTAQTQTTDQQQQQQTQPMPGMGPGMGNGPGMGMGPGMGGGQGGGRMGHRGMGGGGCMMGGGPAGGPQAMAQQEITPEFVKTQMEARMQRKGNPRLKLGEVTKQADGSILVTVVTKKENAVVDKLVIDPKTNTRKRID